MLRRLPIDDEILNNIPQAQKKEPEAEERVLVEMKDGTLIWLQGEALELYDKNELDLNSGFKTPEQKQKRTEILNEISRIAEELYPPKNSETI